MKKISLLLIGLAFIGCVKNNPTVTITNNSSQIYDSIYVYASKTNPSVFKNIKSNDKVTGVIVFDNTIQEDGSYTIRLFKNNEAVRQKSFGYYTNGASLDSNFEIVIESDSIKIK